MEKQPLIQIEEMTKVFYTDEIETHALSGVHLTINKGEYVAMSGPSGCGKSTLLSIIGLLDTPTAGKYMLNGKPVENLDFSDRSRIRNQEIGFVFQGFNLIGDMTVFENVEQPLAYSNMRVSERRGRVTELLEMMGIADRARSRPGQLSGGHQQLVAIARALACKPTILLADEPTGNLDSTSGQMVMKGTTLMGVEVVLHHNDLLCLWIALGEVLHELGIFRFGTMLIDLGDSFTCQWLHGCQQCAGVVLLIAVVLFGDLPFLSRNRG